MRAFQLIAISTVYMYIVIRGAQVWNPPLWLVSTIVIGPFMAWLFAPMFLRRPKDRREIKCPPSLLDMLLDRHHRP